MKLKTGVVGIGPRGLFFCTMIDDDPETELAEVMAAEKAHFWRTSLRVAGKAELHSPTDMLEGMPQRWLWPLRRVLLPDRR